MIDFEITDSFNNFLSSLESADHIKISPDYLISLKNKEAFLEFGFGLYLLWLHAHKRGRYPLLYFTKVNSDNTLFVVTPYEDSSYLIRPKGYQPGQLYIDEIESCFPTPNKSGNCQFCYVRNSLLFNISFFAHTEAFRVFFTDKFLEKIQQDFPKKGRCESCKSNYFKWIREKITQKENFGVCLGGYPALLKVSPKIFKILFSAPLETSELNQESIKLFDYFLTVYLADKFCSTKYTSNSIVISPFSSFEVDVAILIEKDSVRNLLVVETTSYYHEYERLKNKLLNYSALSKGSHDKFLYLYVTLSQEPFVKFKSPNKDLQKLDVTNKELGTLSSLMSNSDIVRIGLSPEFKDIDSFLQKDWWNTDYLRRSFNYLVGSIEENSKILSI